MKIKIFALPLLLATACADQPQKPDPRMCVETARVSSVETAAVQEFPFIAKPLRTSVLSFRVSGPINRFEAYAGNHYWKGELIAEIDSRDFQLRYEQARATYVAAQTARDAAFNALNDTQLRAPFDGYVGEVFIECYQDVKASQPVVTLVDISSLRIEIYVTQEIAMRARDLDEVAVEFDHFPGESFQARVVECARSTTPNNLSYLLTAMLPNSDGMLPAGISGRVQFELPGEARHAVAIPRKALCHTSGEGDCVWTVDTASGRIARRKVSLGELLPGDRVVVSAGLTVGETVAVSGLRFLEEAQIVELTDPCESDSVTSPQP